MRLNQFIFLIASTVVLGAVAGVVTSLTAVWVHVPWFIGLITGAFLATTSLMGLWAYLMLNFIASVSLPRRVWRWAQALILLVVLYDMLWSRYHIDLARHPSTHAPLASYLVQGIWPLVLAVAGAAVKRRLSGRGSFLPSLFYLYVFTVIDWLLVIRTGTGGVVNETGFIMMMCNIYLLLVYGKLLSPPEERAAWASMAAARIEEKKRFKEAKAKVRQTKRDRRRAGGSAPQTGETEPTQTESVQ